MDKKFRVRSGIVPGRYHILSNSNCQDAFKVAEIVVKDRTFILGVICDGCGSSPHSEVGAKLISSFVISRLGYFLQNKVPFGKLIPLLNIELTKWMADIIRPLPDAKFIIDYLLTTIIGFVIGPKETLVLASGDGLVMINGDIDFRDQGNTPDYFAYQFVYQQLDYEFDVYRIPTKKLNRLAIGSDAWEHESDLIYKNEIWGINHPNGIQRKLNVWSKKEHRFKDDATIICAERVK